MIITVLTVRGVVFCSYRGLLNSWGNHLKTGRDGGMERLVGCRATMAPIRPSPETGTPHSDPRVSKVPGGHCVLNRDQSPVLDIMGVPVSSNPTPQLRCPRTEQCRTEHFHFASSAGRHRLRSRQMLHIPSGFPILLSGFPLLTPLTYPCPSDALPTPHYPRNSLSAHSEPSELCRGHLG